MSKQRNDEEICGKCIHHRYEYGEWVCENRDSECWGCYTEYRDTCSDFEARQSNSQFSVTVKRK